MVRVKISRFYQELDLEFSLYRPKVCLGVLSLWKKFVNVTFQIGAEICSNFFSKSIW